MEPLTKLILNNKIVDMRNSVKQSRIQSINKLVKEIKKLRDKKGTEEQKIKNLNKADRYHECIQIMKRVKDDDVSKFALMNEKSLAQITNNVNESPETKAIARIADHRPLYIKVKAFREKHPDWKETLPLLFDSLGERYQEKKKRGVPKKKTNSKNTIKSTENKPKRTLGNQKKTSNVTYIENKSGTWRVEKIEPSKEDTRSDRRVVQNNENKSDIINKSSCDKPNLRTENKKVESKSYEKLRKNDPAETEEEAISKENVEERTKKSSKENENPIGGEEVTKTIDPFFVTKDNKEYLSVNVVSSNTTNVEDKKTDFTPTKSKLKTDFSKPKSYEKNTRKFNSKIDAPKKYSKIETKEETLHPSWEAKRKQSSISEFQGKKIKFDD